jgi:hypothetical protein
LEYDKLRLQAEADKRNWRPSRRTRGSHAEIRRLTDAEQAGLGRSRELPDLMIRRDSAARYLQTGTTAARRASWTKGPPTPSSSSCRCSASG